MVFRRGTSVRFHKAEDCVQLIKRPARGTAHPVEKVNLKELQRPRPCLDCYPDAPSAKFHRHRCFMCNQGRQTRPCEHNGGVKVTIAYERLGQLVTKALFVWPDRVRFYEPIAS